MDPVTSLAKMLHSENSSATRIATPLLHSDATGAAHAPAVMPNPFAAASCGAARQCLDSGAYCLPPVKLSQRAELSGLKLSLPPANLTSQAHHRFGASTLQAPSSVSELESTGLPHVSLSHHTQGGLDAARLQHLLIRHLARIQQNAPWIAPEDSGSLQAMLGMSSADEALMCYVPPLSLSPEASSAAAVAAAPSRDAHPRVHLLPACNGFSKDSKDRSYSLGPGEGRRGQGVKEHESEEVRHTSGASSEDERGSNEGKGGRNGRESGERGKGVALNEQEKKVRRLNANREAARRMRLRRSQRVLELDIQVAQLKRANEDTLRKLEEATIKVAVLETKNMLLEEKSFALERAVSLGKVTPVKGNGRDGGDADWYAPTRETNAVNEAGVSQSKVDLPSSQGPNKRIKTEDMSAGACQESLAYEREGEEYLALECTGDPEFENFVSSLETLF